MTKAPEPTFDGCVTFDPKYKLVREARVKDDTIMVAGEIAMANKSRILDRQARYASWRSSVLTRLMTAPTALARSLLSVREGQRTRSVAMTLQHFHPT